MPGDIFTATGAKMFVAPSTTVALSDTLAELEALTWTEVGLIESIGEYGDESSAVTFASLGDGRIRKAKGARDAGTLAVTCAHDFTDTGQLALVAGEGTNLNYPFKVELPNKLTGAGTNELNFFRGLIMSRRKNVGANDNVVRVVFNIGVNSQIYEKAPT
jgi:tail tube protein